MYTKHTLGTFTRKIKFKFYENAARSEKNGNSAGPCCDNKVVSEERNSNRKGNGWFNLTNLGVRCRAGLNVRDLS